MKIEYDGQVYEFDDQDITLKQAMVVQLHTGLSIAAWQNALNVEDGHDPGPEWLKSVQCLYWLVMAQNDVTVPIADADFKVARFLAAYGGAAAAEADAKPPEEPDPTKGSPSPAPSPERASQKDPGSAGEVGPTAS